MVGFTCVLQELESVVWFMAAVDIQSALKWLQLIARHVDNSAQLFTMHNRLNFLVIFISVMYDQLLSAVFFPLENNAFSCWYLLNNDWSMLCLYFCYSWSTFYQLTIGTSERNTKIFRFEPFKFSFCDCFVSSSVTPCSLCHLICALYMQSCYCGNTLFR